MFTKVLCLVLLSSALVLAVPVQEREYDVTTLDANDVEVTTVVPEVEGLPEAEKKEETTPEAPVTTEPPKSRTWFEKAAEKIKEVSKDTVNKVKDAFGKVKETIVGKPTEAPVTETTVAEHTEAPKVEGSEKTWWQSLSDGVTSAYDTVADKFKDVFGIKKAE